MPDPTEAEALRELAEATKRRALAEPRFMEWARIYLDACAEFDRCRAQLAECQKDES